MEDGHQDRLFFYIFMPFCYDIPQFFLIFAVQVVVQRTSFFSWKL